MRSSLSPRSWGLIALVVGVLLALVYAGSDRRDGSLVGQLPPECVRFPDLPREGRDTGPGSKPWLRLGGYGYVANSPSDGVGPEGRFTVDMYVHALLPPSSPRVALTVCGAHGSGVLAHATSLTPKPSKDTSDTADIPQLRAMQGIRMTVRLPRSALQQGRDFMDLMDSDPPDSNDSLDQPVIVATLTSPDLDSPLTAASCDSYCDEAQGRSV